MSTRYYVLEPAAWADLRAYVLAEIVCEEADRFTLLGSPDAQVFTRDELLSAPGGQRALLAWESADDSAYEQETSRIVAAAREDDEHMVQRRKPTPVPHR